MKRQKSKIANVKFMAKQKFTKWPRSTFEEVLAEGDSVWHGIAVNFRIAVGLMTRSKTDLVKFCRQEEDAALNTLECLANAQESLKQAVEILHAAECRLLCAGSVVAQEKEAA